MADKKVTVLARFKAKKGLEKQAREVIMVCVAPTRAEYGCINYDLHVSPDDPALLFLYENWVSKKTLDEHLKMPYLVALLGKADDLFAEPIGLSLWEKIP